MKKTTKLLFTFALFCALALGSVSNVNLYGSASMCPTGYNSSRAHYVAFAGHYFIVCPGYASDECCVKAAC